MRHWIVFGCTACVALGAAWYFGKSASKTSLEPTSVQAPTVVAEKPADLPPLKMVEVIDLSAAYEPAPEEESSTNSTASFIYQPEVPARMPYARNETTPSEKATPDRLDIMPRQVTPAS